MLDECTKRWGLESDDSGVDGLPTLTYQVRLKKRCGPDALLGTLEADSFVVDSMNPIRNATPMSVAAHSLYEQGDPYRVYEPEGTLFVDGAKYEQVDAHRTRVSGARWEPAKQFTG